MPDRVNTIALTSPGVRRVFREVVVACDLEETFRFFSDARNLESLTPPWVNFRIITPTPIAMCVGALIDYRIRVRGIPLTWRTEIRAWEPPHRFVDVQIRGPYRLWHHEHRFERVGGGTRVIDEVHYLAPFAWISHPLMVTRDVERIFDYRSEALAGLLDRSRDPADGRERALPGRRQPCA